MSDLVQRLKGPNSREVTFHDAVLAAALPITINQDNYVAALDLVYNVKGLKAMHVDVQNTGEDGLTFKIESARKEYTLLTSLVDGDFNNDLLADTNVVGGDPATGTITCAGVLAGDTVTVNGLLYTAVAGAKANDTQFSIDTGDNECATDLADSIDDDTRVGTLDDLTATATTNVVTAVQTVSGTAGDATTLVSSNGTRLAVSGATFSGGVDAGLKLEEILAVSPASTAIRIRFKRLVASTNTTMKAIVSGN